MSKSIKRTREEMVELAYDLQNSIIALCGKRPVRIETNKDHQLFRVVWGHSYERKDWYDGAAISETADILKILSFSSKVLFFRIKLFLC